MIYSTKNPILITDIQTYQSELESLLFFLLHYPLEENSVENPEVITAICRLEFLARDDERSIQASKEDWFLKFTEAFRELYGQWETLLEFREARRLLKGKRSTFLTNSDQINRTFSFAEEEGNAAGVNKSTRVAFIGSGPFHESAISIASTFGCSVDCFDYNPRAVNLSLRLNKKLGFEDKIRIFNRSAVAVDFKDYDVIWMAVLTKNKENVLSRIFETKPKAMVVCRSVDGAKNLLYEGISSDKINRYKLVQKVESSNYRTIVHSLVLTA